MSSLNKALDKIAQHFDNLNKQAIRSGTQRLKHIPAGNYIISFFIDETGRYDDFETGILNNKGDLINPRHEFRDKIEKFPWLSLFMEGDICVCSKEQIMEIKKDLENLSK